VTSFLIAPAVTPWETTLPGIQGGAGNNPGIRLVEYDRQDGRILDVFQYFLNLTAATLVNTDHWLLAYRAQEYYQVQDMTTSSLNTIAGALWNDEAVFDRYYKANGLFFPDKGWTQDYRTVHYCAVTQLDTKACSSCYARLKAQANAAARVPSVWVVSMVMVCVMVSSIYNHQ